MAKLKVDSPLCRRIVQAFLDFLDSVEPASDDLESLEVAKECLTEVFKIDPSSVVWQSEPDLLVNTFRSQEASGQHETDPGCSHDGFLAAPTNSSSVQNATNVDLPEASQSQGEDWTSATHTIGVSRDELFGQYFGALEKTSYFKTTSDGRDDQAQLDRASHIFHNALVEMENSGCQTFDTRNLAETLKSQGNKAMQSKLYDDAIELYTCAIALCEDNSVYYCNRAAAYTQIQQFTEAIRDSQKSIEIDPNYSKAYSRLGFAYYAQGNYRDAIDKGFLKALQLDPSNDSVKENIQVAEQKLKEEQQRTVHNQNSSSASHRRGSSHQSSGESRSHTTPQPFTSSSININALPSDFANMFMNMAANAYQGQEAGNGAEAGSNVDAFSEPGIRMGGNVTVNFGEQMPEEFSGALRSVMEMFSGAAPHGNPQDNMNGRPAPT